MKRQHIVIGVVLIAALCAGAWWYQRQPAAVADTAKKQLDEASVLVRTEAVRLQELPLTMTVFGEVATGKPETLSFPQAGQLVRLAVVAGQQLRRGDLIATLNGDPTVQSAYAQAASALNLAQHELRRLQDLLALQLATQSQVDAAAKQLKDAQAVLAAQSKLGGARPTPTLVAPFDGVVIAVPVAQGDRVQSGAAVVQLGRSSTLRILLAIEPAQSALVKVGMPVTITPVQDNAGSIKAAITEMQKLIDPKTRMVTAIVNLPASPDTRLLSGMRVQAAITLGQRQAWAVPRQAVLNDDKGAYLFQVASRRASRVDVTKLVEAGQSYGVEGKIDPKLPAVVLGNYELRDGMSVREEVR
jgi:membrane fusion protein (multidrug efflux system)